MGNCTQAIAGQFLPSAFCAGEIAPSTEGDNILLRVITAFCQNL